MTIILTFESLKGSKFKLHFKKTVIMTGCISAGNLLNKFIFFFINKYINNNKNDII